MSNEIVLEEVTLVVTEPEIVEVVTEFPVVLPVVEVDVPGIQGSAAVERPLEIDPLETYLKARGDI